LLYATALTDAPIWQYLDRHEVQPVFIALGREIVAVAEAEGIKLESFDGFDPHAFSAHAGYQAAFASMDVMSEHNAMQSRKNP